jgi:hypothetical protein
MSVNVGVPMPSVLRCISVSVASVSVIQYLHRHRACLDVFSYHKNHQDFLLKIYNYLKRENVPVWIDIHDGIDKDISQR